MNRRLTDAPPGPTQPLAGRVWQSVSKTDGGGSRPGGAVPLTTVSADLRTNHPLRATGINKVFGTTQALDDVHFQLEPGTFYALLGPSGCGKTTLLKILAGLEQPTAGEVHLGERELTSVPPFRRPINTVFQQYALFPHMSVSKNVGYALRQRRPRPEKAEIGRRVEEALELVRMGHLKDRNPWELSGGQQQRVALARALVAEPEVLLLDESLSALDAKLRREMQGELKFLQQSLGITFVFVTHDQSEALYMADRIAVMNEGRIVQDAAPVDVYDRPANTWVGSFIGSINYIQGQVSRSESDLTWVSTAGREVAGVPTARLSPGQSVCIGLRPERIQIMTASAPDVDVELSGQVQKVDFHGDQIDLRLDTQEAGSILVRRPLPPGGVGEIPGTGDRIVVGWQHQWARVIEDCTTISKEENL